MYVFLGLVQLCLIPSLRLRALCFIDGYNAWLYSCMYNTHKKGEGFFKYDNESLKKESDFWSFVVHHVIKLRFKTSLSSTIIWLYSCVYKMLKKGRIF